MKNIINYMISIWAYLVAYLQVFVLKAKERINHAGYRLKAEMTKPVLREGSTSFMTSWLSLLQNSPTC